MCGLRVESTRAPARGEPNPDTGEPQSAFSAPLGARPGSQSLSSESRRETARTLAAPVVDGVSEARALDHREEEEEEEDSLCEDSLFLFILSVTLAQA